MDLLPILDRTVILIKCSFQIVFYGLVHFTAKTPISYSQISESKQTIAVSYVHSVIFAWEFFVFEMFGFRSVIGKMTTIIINLKDTITKL